VDKERLAVFRAINWASRIDLESIRDFFCQKGCSERKHLKLKQMDAASKNRRKLICLLTAWLLCAGMPVIDQNGFGSAVTGSSAPAAESIDLFPHKARIHFARGFTITYHRTYKCLKVFTSRQNAAESFVYILVARGYAPPPDLPRGALVLSIPLKRFALCSNLWTAFLPMLHIEKTVVGIAGCDWVHTPEVLDLIHKGRIAEIGDGGHGMNRQINMERLVLLKPDAVMVYATGIPEFDVAPKLLEAGFKPVINASYMEATPLGRTEWIKFIAAFFNKEAEAERIFDDIAGRYEALAEKTRNVSHRPTVFCNTAWRGTWYIPGGGSYMARFLKDAGADYLWREEMAPGSISLPIEAIVERARNAEFWLDTGTCGSLTELREIDDRYKLFSAFRTGNVFNNNADVNAAGGNDFWETGAARPDLVLADLISIFHPELVPNHRRIWYQRLQLCVEKRR
jgi:iron complex transport system substrate-binding protein